MCFRRSWCLRKRMGLRFEGWTSDKPLLWDVSGKVKKTAVFFQMVGGK